MPKKLDSILIADDNREVLMALRVLLNNYFHIVETINNPECIPMMLAQRDWSVMLLDMNFKAGINSGNEGL